MAESEAAARIAFIQRKTVYYVTCQEWDEVSGYSGNRRLSQQYHSQAQLLTPSKTAASLAQALEMAEKVSIRIRTNMYIKVVAVVQFSVFQQHHSHS